MPARFLSAAGSGRTWTRFDFKVRLTLDPGTRTPKLRLGRRVAVRLPRGFGVAFLPLGIQPLPAELLGPRRASTGEILSDCHLLLRLDDGTRIEVAPGEKHQAWEVVLCDGRRVVCMPGGGMSQFSGPEEPQREG